MGILFLQISLCFCAQANTYDVVLDCSLPWNGCTCQAVLLAMSVLLESFFQGADILLSTLVMPTPVFAIAVWSMHVVLCNSLCGNWYPSNFYDAGLCAQFLFFSRLTVICCFISVYGGKHRIESLSDWYPLICPSPQFSWRNYWKWMYMTLYTLYLLGLNHQFDIVYDFLYSLGKGMG